MLIGSVAFGVLKLVVLMNMNLLQSEKLSNDLL